MKNCFTQQVNVKARGDDPRGLLVFTDMFCRYYLNRFLKNSTIILKNAWIFAQKEGESF